MGIGDTLGKEIQGTNDFKTERDYGNENTMVIVLGPRSFTTSEAHVIINTNELNPNSAHWNEFNWGSGYWKSYTGYLPKRIVNPNRTYIDNLYGTTFKDTTSTAIWTGSGEITF